MERLRDFGLSCGKNIKYNTYGESVVERHYATYIFGCNTYGHSYKRYIIGCEKEGLDTQCRLK